MGFGVERVDFEHQAQRGFGGMPFVALQLDVSQACGGFQVAGPGGQSPGIALLGLHESLFGEHQVAEVEMGFGKLRIELDGSPVTLDGLGRLALQVE